MKSQYTTQHTPLTSPLKQPQCLLMRDLKFGHAGLCVSCLLLIGTLRSVSASPSSEIAPSGEEGDIEGILKTSCESHITGMKAVVVGATGAIGAELVAQLVASPAWSRVTTVGRRAVQLPPAAEAAGDPSKLHQTVVDMDKLGSKGGPAFAGADTVFCALGTTRGTAGSAEGFVKVDLTYVAETAKLAKEAGVRHFSLVTAEGANPNVPASTFLPLHPLLYMRTKGQAEEAVKACGFERVSIFRPGMLDRGAHARGIEKVASFIMPSIAVADVARVMLLDASNPAPPTGNSLYRNTAIVAAAKANQPPVPTSEA